VSSRSAKIIHQVQDQPGLHGYILSFFFKQVFKISLIFFFFFFTDPVLKKQEEDRKLLEEIRDALSSSGVVGIRV
jgi:hypothetical protein